MNPLEFLKKAQMKKGKGKEEVVPEGKGKFPMKGKKEAIKGVVKKGCK